MSIPELAARAPELREAYDATKRDFRDYAVEVEAWLDAQPAGYAELDAKIRSELTAEQALGLRFALKLAESRRRIRDLDQPVTVTLLNPVYKETGRMQTRAQHPHGEDSIRVKIETLRALERLNDLFHARLVVIDDECPVGSGELARSILAEYPESVGSGDYRVLSLREAIDSDDPVLPPGLTHKDGANRSVKGGALLYGMRKCVTDSVEGRHILIDNDADLSIHPAQIGLLISDITSGVASAVAGSRREPDSVATIGGSRNTRGRLFIEIWRHFLPQLAAQITDTNRAFKAFESQALASILDGVETYTFPYQIELLQACVARGVALTKCGIGYLDSEAASTQQGENITETYLSQIHRIIAIARNYGTIDPSDPLPGFFESISEERWREIEREPPERITSLA